MSDRNDKKSRLYAGALIRSAEGDLDYV
jgi:hypothetical protein